MTLQELLIAIEELGTREKIINYATAGADIYALNNNTVKDYPALFISPTGTHYIGINSTRFSITLYYFDRLLNDSENEIGILSVAIEELKNLVKGIEQIPGVVNVQDEYQCVNFTETEAFDDRIAGAYCTIDIEVLNNTICYEE